MAVRSLPPQPVPPRLQEHLARLYPDHHVTAIVPLGPDAGAEGASDLATVKAVGYGLPVRIVLTGPTGVPRELVWRLASANEFGHDRRADRAGGQLLAYDDFPRIPRHVEALDVGAIRSDGELVSLRDAGELYLLTSYVRGSIYADDLRRIARDGRATDLDVARADALASYLAALHIRIDDPPRYRRAVRDLVGHGEGIFGMIDGYPPDVPAASPRRLQALEERCVPWRWRLRAYEHRLARTHGDFHPFNVVFSDAVRFSLLDASRGTCGEPADDLTALAINYLLFALDQPAAWRDGFGRLWHQLWRVYQLERRDPQVREVAPPYFAWRALVVCNPRFYPGLDPIGRDALLRLAERALDERDLDPAWADELFG